jgi:plasmid stabilization system protein ParE
LKPVRLRRVAKRDLAEAISWYRERNEEVADRFAAEVQRTIQHLEQFPSTGGFVPGVADPDVRGFPVHNFPYHVIFVRLADRISVLAIAHNRRQPGYWNVR